MTLDDIIGSWTLISWQSLKNGTPSGYPMGEDAKGQIIYSAEGRMSGFLMRADFADAPRATLPDPNTSLAYGGTYRIEGSEVVHDVLVSTIPYWIGNPLVRTMVPVDGELLLKTAPEKTGSGNVYEHHLRWRRV
jgi:hypothetical protein